MNMCVLTTTIASGLAGSALATTPSLSLNMAEAMTAASTAQPAKKEPMAAGSSFWQGWGRTVEVGLNGAEGNTTNFNVRAALGLVRDAADMTTTAGLTYRYGSSESVKDKSNGEAFLRNDWKIDERWGFFAIVKAEYDEFQEWDWRLSGFLGPSYLFINNDRTMLRGRVGVGASYEFGGELEEEEINPELDIGIDLSHKITDRTKFTATVDYYPSLKDFPDYRLVASAGLEVLVDPEINMFLKLGAQNRYDSTTKSPNKKNDLDYFLTLAWAF
jgi:putative salt-induced outer membrane protein YdiY